MQRVLVLGAGVAGLAAARALTHLGYEVIVLEARDRPGGRCWTDGGVELGAQWIHTTEGNPVSSLARELGLPTLFVGGDSTYIGGWDQLHVLGSGGRVVEPEERLRGILVADEVRDALEALRRQVQRDGGADMSIGAAYDRVLAERSLRRAERDAVDWHRALLVRDDCAADDDDLSFLWWDDGYEVYGYGDSVVVDGYGALVARLSDGVDVRLSCVVHTVHYGSAVAVETDRGSFTADSVVVTLPLGVLKSDAVRFEPELPERKRTAIARLGVGVLNKAVVHFETPVWPREQYAFGTAVAPLETSPTIVLNLWKTHRLPALVLTAGGKLGCAMETWPDDQLRCWAMRLLRGMFGDGLAEPLSVQRTRWLADPFARGAYSYIAVGATPADIEALAEPVSDTLYFAGEATVRQHWATVHGAYVSGLREAAAISGRRDLLPPRQFTENRRFRDMMQRANRFFNLRGRALMADELMERVGVLRQSSVFGLVPQPELEVLATMFDSRMFSAGERICTAGDIATDLFVIASGDVSVEVAGRVQSALAAGSVFGEYGMFGGGKRSATITALRHTTVLALDYQRFQRFLLAFPESMQALLHQTVTRLLAREASD